MQGADLRHAKEISRGAVDVTHVSNFWFSNIHSVTSLEVKGQSLSAHTVHVIKLNDGCFQISLKLTMTVGFLLCVFYMYVPREFLKKRSVVFDLFSFYELSDSVDR